MADRGVVLHLPESWLAPNSTEMLPFYQKLKAGFDEIGVPWRTEAIDRDNALKRVAQDDWFHIFNHSHIQQDRVLNAGVAYVYPFWNVDPMGIRAFSSIADTKFVSGKIDDDKARRFFGRLRRRWMDKRSSRYPQPEESLTIPDDSVAVFLQSEGDRNVDETCYMDRWTMLETVLKSWDGSVVVKPHPKEHDPMLGERLEAMQKVYPDLHVVTGNIHDILAQCQRVVTINSAVGIEAYMHRKPVILCGQADFHHLADVARTPEKLQVLLEQEPRGRVYAKYLYWYFGLQCLDASRRDKVIARQVVRRMAAQGYDIKASAKKLAAE
ncbi:MAG: capsular polysaccharide export protein, LipB/KpsS family [Shimia sp.]|uniref:capsular polysaccharide export protein, LipB/KpsS family n=1 Tax=Shimia sp. TaxID=1954381 RepID=UPI00405890DE